MTKGLLRGWFVCSTGEGSIVNYVVQADTEEEARESLGVLSEGRDVLQLTWQGIADLTGCIIPLMFNPSNWVCGNLMFYYGGRCFVIWQKLSGEG